MTDIEKLIEKMDQRMIQMDKRFDQRIARSENLLHELVTQNMLTGQRLDETNKRIDANIEAMRQESAETNKRIDANIEAMRQESAERNKRIDETNKRIDANIEAMRQESAERNKRVDETNKRIDEKFDIALKQNFMQGQQIQQQQIELTKMFKRSEERYAKNEEYYIEIMEKLDNLPDDIQNKIGFQPVTK